LGQIEQAVDYARQALAIHKTINYRRNQIYDLLHLADAHANIGQLDKALEYFKQAQDTNREVNERLVACLILNNMSIAYTNWVGWTTQPTAPDVQCCWRWKSARSTANATPSVFW